MIKSSFILTGMKVTLIVIAMLASIVSMRAQGLISEGVNTTGDVISGEINFATAITYESSDTSSQQIEAYRGITLLGQPVQPPLPPTPISDPPSDFQPPVSSFTIQSVPEPSTIALGSLTIGLIFLVRLSRRQQILKR
jgi:hypothetical protein